MIRLFWPPRPPVSSTFLIINSYSYTGHLFEIRLSREAIEKKTHFNIQYYRKGTLIYDVPLFALGR